MTVTLAETPAGGASSLPPGTDPAALHAAVTAEVTAALGAAHAALFARPVAGTAGVAWTAPGTEARRFADLSAPDRQALLAAAGSIASDLRRLVERGGAPGLAAAWPAMRDVPGPGALFAVDGRPVLAPWGRPGATDLLAAHDDGRSWSAPARVRWLPYGVALAAVALLALAAGLLLPTVARWSQPAAAMCRIEDGQLDLLRRQAAAGNRGEELKKLLATVNDDIGRQQLQCPIPQAEAAATPPPVPAAPPVPAVPPVPAPRAELPADRWNDHDMAMLEGCWHSTTQMTTRNEATGEIGTVVDWRLCFDRGGRGRQSIRWSNGRTCTGPMSANFAGNNDLNLTDTDHCAGPGANLRRGVFDCRRVNDTEASCTRMDTEGPSAGQRQTGRFVR